MKILTMIVPAYNSEKFLERCVDSMPLRTRGDMLEILIVNDGSRDRTGEIADSCAKRYPDSVRVIHQENRGHGGALNAGCAAATGKYLKVIDADDRVEPADTEAFLEILAHSESDVVLTHYSTEHIGTGLERYARSFPGTFAREYRLGEIMGRWKDFDRVLTFHGITYKTSFYRRLGVSLTEGVYYEDHEYATFPCCMAQSLLPLDLTVYRYRIGDTAQSVSEENRIRRLGDTEAVLRSMIRQYRVRQGEMTEAGRIYVQRKVHGLLMSHLITLLLAHPVRKQGRAAAEEMMESVRILLPEAADMTETRYRLLRAMHALRVPKGFVDSVLQSRIYNRLRRNHDYA